MTDKLNCFYHPERETRVSCGRCGRGLCPDCVRHGATGVRCRECISLSPEERGLATHQQIRNALLAALGAAAPVGLMFGLLDWVNIVSGAALGFAVGVAAFYGSGRHRDTTIQAAAGAMALAGVLLAAVISSLGMPGVGGQLGAVLVNISFSEFIGPSLAAIVGAMVRFLF